MDPEVWIGVVAVFISGGALGAAGILTAQWLVRNIGEGINGSGTLSRAEGELMKIDVADLARKMDNIDQRLDFQERLLGGQTPMGGQPARLPDPAPRREAPPAAVEPEE